MGLGNDVPRTGAGVGWPASGAAAGPVGSTGTIVPARRTRGAVSGAAPGCGHTAGGVERSTGSRRSAAPADRSAGLRRSAAVGRSRRSAADSRGAAAGGPRGEGGAPGPGWVTRLHTGPAPAPRLPESPAAPTGRVLGAYAAGGRAGVRRAVSAPSCRPMPRRRASTIGGPCVPERRFRPRRARAGGARRLAGEVRAGLADRVLAGTAVALGSATVVVLLGLLAQFAAAR